MGGEGCLGRMVNGRLVTGEGFHGDEAALK